MTYLAIACLVLSVVILSFVLTHLRPLSSSEIAILAQSRRTQAIRRYYAFQGGQAAMDKDFKKNMKPTGDFYRVSGHLSSFPATAASHLKYKKHEWIIVAFEKDQAVDLMWLNKGCGWAVGPAVPFDRLVELGVDMGCTSVLVLHNHPNSLRGRYRLYNILPSKADIETAKEWGQTLDAVGMGFAFLVCDRGTAYPIKIKCPEAFKPLDDFLLEVQESNGTSRRENLRLHYERIFNGPGGNVAALGDY